MYFRHISALFFFFFFFFWGGGNFFWGFLGGGGGGGGGREDPLGSPPGYALVTDSNRSWSLGQWPSAISL